MSESHSIHFRHIRTGSVTLRGKAKPSTVPCQDWTIALNRGSNEALLVVCDGVGSVSNAETGAQLAGRFLAEAAFEDWTAAVNEPSSMIMRVRDRWFRSIYRDNGRPTNFATTLGYVAISGTTISGCLLGDLFVIGRRNDQTGDPDSPLMVQMIASQGRENKLLLNQTEAISDPTVESTLRPFSLVRAEWRGVMISSDGLERVTTEPYADSHGRVRQRAIPGVSDVLLSAFGSPLMPGSDEMAHELSTSDSIMSSKGDDIGVALAVW